MQHVTDVGLIEALNFGALNVVFNTWVFLGFFTYEIWAEFKKSCGNTGCGVWLLAGLLMSFV